VNRVTVYLVLVAVLVLAMEPAARAGGGWYLMMPSDNQIMMDGSIAKGVTVAQYPQIAAFDTAAACNDARNVLLRGRHVDALKAVDLAEEAMRRLSQVSVPLGHFEH